MELPPEIWREILSYNVLPFFRRVSWMFNEIEISLMDERVRSSDIVTATKDEHWEYVMLFISTSHVSSTHMSGCSCRDLCMIVTPHHYRIGFMLIDKCIGEINLPPPSMDRYLDHHLGYFNRILYPKYESVLAACACIDDREDVLQLLYVEEYQWSDMAILAMKRNNLSMAKLCIMGSGYQSVIYEQAWKLGHIDIIQFMKKNFTDKKGRWKKRHFH